MPPFIRLLASPAGALIVRLPDKPERQRAILRSVGHGPAVDAGRMDRFIAWRVALTRHTDSLRSERAMVRTIVDWRRAAFRPGLTLDDAELAGIAHPALYVYGTADPVGSEALWSRVAGLLPRGELHLVPDAGHLPWFDDPVGVAARMGRFLREAGEVGRSG